MSARPLSSAPLRALAAVLCLAVCVIHLKDQNWFAFDKDPGYVLAGYLALEAGAVVAAVWLMARPSPRAWLLAAAVGAGPLLGYVLSRGTGLPSYTDDIGNWSEMLGVVSLFVEGALLAASVAVLVGDRRAGPRVVSGEGALAAADRDDRRSTARR